jgi:cysteine desulfurase NifS
MDKIVYLDYNATTPIDPEVAGIMHPLLKDYFGNPSSSHSYGIKARQKIIIARQQVSEMLGCTPEEVVFTSGGSESNNYAIRGIAKTYIKKGNHIITSMVEHPAVLEVCKALENEGFRISRLKVDSFGRVNPMDVASEISPETILISIMHANNEVGTIQDIAQISEIAHRNNIIMHTDAAQSIGKIPVKVNTLDVDLLSVAGHKFYAPKGVGALYIRSGWHPEKLIYGADHELNRRAGTENILGIAGIGAACSIVERESGKEIGRLKHLRDRLEYILKKELPDVRINGHQEQRLPNTCSISFKNLKADKILANLKKVAASAGAACHSDDVRVSHVLEAMNVPQEYAVGTIRLSVGRFTTAEEIEISAQELIKAVKSLRH